MAAAASSAGGRPPEKVEEEASGGSYGGGGPDKKVACNFSMTRHRHIVLDQYPSMLLLLERKG